MSQKFKNTECSWFLYAAAASVNLLTFGLGIAYAWASASIPKLNGNINSEGNPLETPTTLTEDSWIASLLNLGALLGPLFAGVFSDKIGRKRTLLYFSWPMMASHVIMIFASTVIEFFIARFLIGVSVGVCFSVTPIYLSEIATKENRGLLGLSFALTNACGQLLTCIVGPYVSIRIFSIIALVPCLLFLITFSLIIPESPYYYLLIDNEKEAECSLRQIRGSSYSNKELVDIIRNVGESKLLGKAGVIDLFKNKIAVKGLIIGVGLMFVQCCSGILPVLAYLQTICSSTGTSIPEEISVMIVSAFQLITILIVSKIINNMSRKLLFLLSVIGCITSLALLGAYFYLKDKHVDVSSVFWLPLASLIFYFIFFNIGLGPLCWNVAGEIFAPNVKAISSTIVTFSNLSFGFLTMMLFPSMSQSLGMPGILWVFAGITCLSIPFITFVVPETKGKSLMEIQDILNGVTKGNF